MHLGLLDHRQEHLLIPLEKFFPFMFVEWQRCLQPGNLCKQVLQSPPLFVMPLPELPIELLHSLSDLLSAEEDNVLHDSVVVFWLKRLHQQFGQ